MYTVYYTLYNVHYILYKVQYTVYNVHYTVNEYNDRLESMASFKATLTQNHTPGGVIGSEWTRNDGETGE